MQHRTGEHGLLRIRRVLTPPGSRQRTTSQPKWQREPPISRSDDGKRRQPAGLRLPRPATQAQDHASQITPRASRPGGSVRQHVTATSQQVTVIHGNTRAPPETSRHQHSAGGRDAGTAACVTAGQPTFARRSGLPARRSQLSAQIPLICRPSAMTPATGDRRT